MLRLQTGELALDAGQFVQRLHVDATQPRQLPLEVVDLLVFVRVRPLFLGGRLSGGEFGQFDGVVFADAGGDSVAAGGEVVDGQFAGVRRRLLLLPPVPQRAETLPHLLAVGPVRGHLRREFGYLALA